MLLLIAMAYAGVYVSAGFGTSSADEPLPDRLARLVASLLLDNRAFPMFAILFGYGLSWMVRRRLSRGDPPGHARRLLRRRGLFLLAFGAVHAFLVFPGEILAAYGLATLVTGWLLFRSDKAIVRAATITAACYLLTVPIGMVGLAAAPETGGASPLPGYATLGDWIARVAAVPFSPLFVTFAYPLLLMVLLGFWAARRRLLDEPERNRATLRRIAVVGIGVSVAGAIPAAAVDVGGWDPGVGPVTAAMALQVLTGVLGGAGYAALFGLLGSRLRAPYSLVTTAVTAVGQRSLTCYLANSVLVAVLLHPDLIGLGTSIGAAGALLCAVAVWAATACAALGLAHSGRPGPADALLQRLVNGGSQGSGRSAVAGASPTP
ncbi:DUF418 domain-containing protein [Georgenia alba]|uniref:DUF418 domain-containing protein n=1 Tax=Georgenia alba TaxID=2233858 RepID=A0ABW2Q3H0_9MICO